MKEIKKAIRSRVLIDDTYCWTDANVVLGWIKGKEKCWKPWGEGGGEQGVKRAGNNA